MNVDESVGRPSPNHVRADPPTLHLQDSRAERRPWAFIVAILLHVLTLLSLMSPVPLPGLSFLQELAPAPEPRPTPVRVVFYETPRGPVPTPPPDTTDFSDTSQGAQSEIEPEIVDPDERLPAADGSSKLKQTAQQPQEATQSAPPANPTPTPSAEPKLTEMLSEALKERLRQRRLRPRPTPSSSRTPVTQPGTGTGSAFSPSAIDAAVRQQGFSNRSSSVSSTGPMSFDAKDFEWGPYARKVYVIVNRNWQSVIPLAARTPGVFGQVRVRFRISKSGAVDMIELASSSGRVSLDQAAMASIELSNPLPPLPAHFGRDEVGVTFSYFYNMDPPR